MINEYIWVLVIISTFWYSEENWSTAKKMQQDNHKKGKYCLQKKVIAKKTWGYQQIC